jgi:hypothetical protein
MQMLRNGNVNATPASNSKVKTVRKP